MTDLLTNALKIAEFMYDHGHVGGNTITVAELRSQVDLSREDFDNADIYLLEARHSDGTMGGDLGKRRLTAQGVIFVASRSKPVPTDLTKAVTPASVTREEPQTACILFTDIVGFSKLRLHEQQRAHRELTTLINSVPVVNRSRNEGELLTLPTGDGVAVVFLRGLRRHVDAAISLSRELRNNQAIKVRMGLHTGPVQRVVDVNQNSNVVGPGINIAQRVMDCGDADHVLVTKDVAEALIELGGFDGSLEDLGTIKVKHDQELHLYSLHTADFGNFTKPAKFLAGTGNVPEVEPEVPAEVDIPEVLAGGLPTHTASPTKLTRVLLTSSDGKAIILGAERIVQAERLTLILIPEDNGDRAFLRNLRSQSSDLLGIAYENIGMHARMKSISSLLEGSVESWTLEVQPFEGDYRGGTFGEMAMGHLSADDIAELRARRILLNEESPNYPTASDEKLNRLNNAMLEVFVQGINTQVKIKGSILPALFAECNGDNERFLNTARLFSVLWLHVSGVVDSITKLEMELVGESKLAVTFEGRRPRTYVNVEPKTIRIEGVTRLAQNP